MRRVGDNTPFYVNVRVLAATNEPLEKRSRKARFAKIFITAECHSDSVAELARAERRYSAAGETFSAWAD